MAIRHSWLQPFVARARPSGPVTIRHGEAAGLRIFGDSRSNIGYALGTTEPVVQEALARYLHEGSVCYDIGANVGFFTILAARLVGETGRVYAFEPLPDNLDALRRNLELNGFANVEVIDAAVSDRDGTAELGIGTSSLDSGLVEYEVARHSQHITVRVMRLDHGELSRPTFVKIDAEGAEFAVLRGMRTLLEAPRPTILCEMHNYGADYVAEFEAALGDAASHYEVGLLEQDPEDDVWAPHVLAVPRR